MNLIGIFKKVLLNALCENKKIGSSTEADPFEAEDALSWNGCRLLSDDPYDFNNPCNVFTSPVYDYMYCNIHYRGPDKK